MESWIPYSSILHLQGVLIILTHENIWNPWKTRCAFKHVPSASPTSMPSVIGGQALASMVNIEKGNTTKPWRSFLNEWWMDPSTFLMFVRRFHMVNFNTGRTAGKTTPPEFKRLCTTPPNWRKLLYKFCSPRRWLHLNGKRCICFDFTASASFTTQNSLRATHRRSIISRVLHGFNASHLTTG